MADDQIKLDALKQLLADMGSVLAAYSGGVDSTFLLKVALDVLGEKVLAVTARSAVHPDDELSTAEEIARWLGARHLLVEGHQLADPDFARNPPERCYLCKRRLLSDLQRLAGEHGLAQVIEGSNHDDLGQYRPGLKAVRELGVRSPLAEAGLTKNEIRRLSRQMGLPTWNKPAQACLATRFPYGTQLTPQRLKRVDKAERFLRSLGLSKFRVRDHDGLARIEVPQEMLHHILSELAPRIIGEFKALGYAYITVDLEGYRSGSMDETLILEEM
jgi:uncharacterized protein